MFGSEKKKFNVNSFALPALAAVVALTGGMLLGCVKEPQKNAQAKPTPMPTISLSQSVNNASIAAGKFHTVGVSISGSVTVSGNNTAGQCMARNWCKINSAVCSSDTTAGLTNDGKVLLAGADEALFKDALAWSDIVSLAIGENVLAGVSAKGYVVAVGEIDKDAVSGWYEITKLAVQSPVSDEKSIVYGLKQNGEVIYTSENGKGSAAKGTAVPDSTNSPDSTGSSDDTTAKPDSGSSFAINTATITDIKAGTGFAAFMYENGDVSSTDGYSVSDADALYCGSDALLTVSDGKAALHCLDEGSALNEIDTSKLTDIACAAIGENHIAVMHKNGTVEAFGANDDMQCETKNMILRPYLDSANHIVGLCDNLSFSRLAELIKLGYGIDISSDISGNELVYTGLSVKDGSKAFGTALIYGDVDGDGKIGEGDATAIDAHINGGDTLKGIKLAAANCLHHVANRLSTAHSSTVRDYAMGKATIIQYDYNPLRAKLNAALDVNSDVIGYIELYGTKVDYPILYGDNWYYNYHNLHKTETGSGSIYACRDHNSKNNPVAGHNIRKSGTYFNGLHTIQDNKDALAVYKNRVFPIILREEFSLYEVYALYETKPDEPEDTNITAASAMDSYTDEQLQAWIDDNIERSEIDLGLTVTADDELITLYTCGDNYGYDSEARLYIFLRKVS